MTVLQLTKDVTCLLATAVSLCALAALPSRASASCGDYVLVGGRSANAHAVDTGKSIPAPVPCHGPMCQQHLPETPVAPVAPPVPAPDEAAFAAVGESGGGIRVASVFADQVGERPVHRAGDIFHPPRHIHA